MQSESEDCHYSDDRYDEDGANRPKTPPTLACLLEEKLGIEFFDEGRFVEQGHGRFTVVADLCIMKAPR